MIQSHNRARSGSNFESHATVAVSVNGHAERANRSDRQNWLAFAIILLLCALVFLVGGALSVGAAVRQADLTADTRI